MYFIVPEDSCTRRVNWNIAGGAERGEVLSTVPSLSSLHASLYIFLSSVFFPPVISLKLYEMLK